MIYVFDIDGTICTNSNGDYNAAEPFQERIKKVNELYDKGNKIIFQTARGMGRTNNNVIKAYKLFYDYTKKQLDEWGVKYHDLFLGKPEADIFIDDKGTHDGAFFD
jgi:hydroxymethylpyrimidine pyrophosphatase-like HAD family hydrolase